MEPSIVIALGRMTNPRGVEYISRCDKKRGAVLVRRGCRIIRGRGGLYGTNDLVDRRHQLIDS